MGYYANCRKSLQMMNAEEVVKINDNVFFNLVFGDTSKGYYGSTFGREVGIMMMKDKRIAEKLFRVTKHHNYDITKDHDYDKYRFMTNNFTTTDFEESMISYLFERSGDLDLTSISEDSHKKAYIEYILNNKIKIEIPRQLMSEYHSVVINSRFMTEEEINLAKEFANYIGFKIRNRG